MNVPPKYISLLVTPFLIAIVEENYFLWKKLVCKSKMKILPNFIYGLCSVSPHGQTMMTPSRLDVNNAHFACFQVE